ncbi:hypothetical protein HHI36_006696 [Cryptolaemus montrouzieri]|uniref:Histone deacetylase complex subunit SAP130 C-terminal domain-containing protein n=1 Tax=Cryptolaemus montrouzieri TaxID=559131 RepID=A0ABD2NYW5_9CUCU
MRPATMGTQVHNIVTNQQMRYNSVMVVDQGRSQPFTSQSNDFSQEQQHSHQNLPPKVTASPRPSILRKRDHEGSPLKAAKNLNAAMSMASLPAQQSNQLPQSPPSPRPDSRGNGNSSGGSTTISATSSPRLDEVNEDSMPPVSENHKEEEDVKPPTEMSPRKKPRKQQLTGNDIDEHNDDMQFISENAMKKEEESDAHSDEPRDGAPEARQLTTVRKPASASLLNSYRQTWKATHNHFLRYSDVRPKDERKPTIIDLANQCKVQDKVNGWKVYHLSTQMEDLADQEAIVYGNLNDLLTCMEKKKKISLTKILIELMS